MISLTRPEYLPLLGKCKVFIDDKHVANLRRCRQTVELNTDEGEHEIYFKVAWLKSNTLKFKTFGSWHFFSLKMNPIFFSLRNTDENFNLVIREDNKVNGRPENKRTLKSFIYQSSMKGV